MIVNGNAMKVIWSINEAENSDFGDFKKIIGTKVFQKFKKFFRNITKKLKKDSSESERATYKQCRGSRSHRLEMRKQEERSAKGIPK